LFSCKFSPFCQEFPFEPQLCGVAHGFKRQSTGKDLSWDHLLECVISSAGMIGCPPAKT
jgi:hypothetical protein